jgi:hypothetical protein
MLVRRTSLMGSLSDLFGAHPTFVTLVLRAGKPSGAFAHILTPAMCMPTVCSV